jgi:hypothetical protein
MHESVYGRTQPINAQLYKLLANGRITSIEEGQRLVEVDPGTFDRLVAEMNVHPSPALLNRADRRAKAREEARTAKRMSRGHQP